MNINFLKFNEHAQTEEFLHMLYANNILPIVTKPTRLTKGIPKIGKKETENVPHRTLHY